MTTRPLRAALFTDSFHEVNGVALTSRQLEAFARRRSLPFFNLHAGPETRVVHEDSVVTYEIARSRARIPVEADLYIDPLFLRYKKQVTAELREFRPDLVHITGPNDIGVLGALAARELKIPLVASWHTNVHQYAACRLEKALDFLPEDSLHRLSGWVDRSLWAAFSKFYSAARIAFAPNPELIELLRERTGKPVYLMERGVDIDLFSPARRRRGDNVFQLGYVGRISAEKNVRFFFELEQALLAAGRHDYRFVIVGHGSEQAWLEERLQRAVFTGVLKGEELAAAYANFDLFIFPSYTDTYGNVIQEAMASGVPVVVTDGGGPKYLVDDGVTGIVARSPEAFAAAVVDLIADRERHVRMRRAARDHACECSWDRVFERLYERYASVAEVAAAA